MSVPAPEALEVSLSGAASRAAVKDVLVRSTLQLQSDNKLVELLREGFAPAFDVMVERYRLPLTRYCARMVGPDNADDIVQETFTASYTALGNDDRPVQLKAWLYRVAHNTAISSLRKKGRQEHEQLDENFDGVRQPHEHLEQSQRLHDLVANMRALPERQRTALVLQELEGLSPEEIADELDGSVPMVRQLVHRARERLRNGVGMLIPLPLILKLFGADTAAAATTKSAGATAVAKSAGAKSVGATFAGAGATGSGAKLAAVLAVAALAGGGVAVERATGGPASPEWKETSADQAARGGNTTAVSRKASTRGHSSGTQRAGLGGASATPRAGGTDSSPASAGERREADRPSNEPRDESGRGGANPGTPAGDGTAPSSPGTPSAPSQSPAAETPPSSGGGGGGASQPSGGGGEPSGGGGTPPAGGGGSQPSCKPVLGIPLPLICLGK